MTDFVYIDVILLGCETLSHIYVCYHLSACHWSQYLPSFHLCLFREPHPEKIDDWCFNGGYLYFCQRKYKSLFTRCLSGFALLWSVTKLNIHHTGKKLFVWFRVTLIGLEVKHSYLQEEKITPLKWYPSLKLRMFHLYHTGAAKRLLWGKVFSASFSLFS